MNHLQKMSCQVYCFLLASTALASIVQGWQHDSKVHHHDHLRQHSSYIDDDGGESSDTKVVVILIVIVVFCLLICLGVGIWLCISGCFTRKSDDVEKKAETSQGRIKGRKKKHRHGSDHESDDDSVAVSTARRSRFSRYRKKHASRDHRERSPHRHRSSEGHRSREHSRHRSPSRHRSRDSRRSSRDRYESTNLSPRSSHRSRSSHRHLRSHGSHHRSSRRSHRKSSDFSRRSRGSRHSHDSRRKAHYSGDSVRESSARRHSYDRRSRSRDSRHFDDSQKQLKQRKSAEKKRSVYKVSSRDKKRTKNLQTKQTQIDNILLEHKPHPIQLSATNDKPFIPKSLVASQTPVSGSLSHPFGGLSHHMKLQQTASSQLESDSEESSEEELKMAQTPQVQVANRGPVPSGAPLSWGSQGVANYKSSLPPGVPMMPPQAQETESSDSDSSESGPLAIPKQNAVMPAQLLQKQQMPYLQAPHQLQTAPRQPMPMTQSQQVHQNVMQSLQQTAPRQLASSSMQEQQPNTAAVLRSPSPAPPIREQAQWAANAQGGTVVPIQHPAQQQTAPLQLMTQPSVPSSPGLQQQSTNLQSQGPEDSSSE